MVKCNDECKPICDFCQHLDRKYEDRDTGESMCLKHSRVVDWLSACECFHCFKASEEAKTNG